tara:strand:- start:2200 stop:2814 length:615 start_codon:yes stop_codon:yes gene_type:complete
MNLLKIVCKYHKEWIEIVERLGGGLYSEDIVQEAYIKIVKYNYGSKIVNKGKVSKGYMYFVLRSIFINYIKQANKVRKVNIDMLYNISGKTWFLDESNNNHNTRNLINKTKEIQQDVVCEDIIRERAYGRICDKIDKELESWHWYDKKIFEVYRDTPLTIRGMAKETKISTVNIFHTLKKGKIIINKKFAEDYEDFKNEDYDLI